MTPLQVEFDVPVPMRDGVTLRANVFRPAAGGPYPVALARTPYGKDFATVSASLDAVRLARAGYLVVVQDVRGRFASEGEWAVMRHEAQDGYDSVEWAARLPGSTGQVGMWGGSYLGFTQWAAALAGPPSLRALVPSVTWADVRDGVFWRGGALELGTAIHWRLNLGFDTLFRQYGRAPDMPARLGALVREIDRLAAEGYHTLPLRGFAPFRRAGLATELDELLDHPNDPAFAAPFSPAAGYDRLAVPALNVGGWYDLFLGGTLRNFVELRRRGRPAHLVIGPWTHREFEYVVGQVDFGFAAQMAWMNLESDLTGLTQRWFDRWLKGAEAGAADEPPVRVFVMGANTWRREAEWPLARTRYRPYYLRAGGALTPEPPAAAERPDHYVYDPADPTPTVGGAILMHPAFPGGPRDQRPLEARPDVLMYTTPPLEQDLEVTGPVTVHLWAASDALDTDFVARLVDVHPDGFSQNLCDGIIRARFRDGARPALLEPGRAYAFTLDLWATANVFRAGHRLRLHIASASFPRWDRNPNTGAPMGAETALRPARQTILHDADHPSHVLLPVIPAGFAT